MHRGYIKLWRKFKDTSFFTKPLAAHLAVYLIMEAQHEPYKRIIGKQERTIERGQVVTGLFKLKKETGLSIQNIRTSMVLLNTCQFLTKESTKELTIITISNYNDYQDNLTNESTKQVTNDQQTTNKRLTTIQEVKEVKECKEVSQQIVPFGTAPEPKQIKEPRKAFIIPTLEQVQEYIALNRLSVNPGKFHAYYTAQGWKVGKNPMKNWKAAIVTWHHKD